MRNLPTPLFEPIRPDAQIQQFIDFWQPELEKQSSKSILSWAIDSYGDGVAFASSWDEGDAVLCSLFEKLSFLLPVVDLIHHLLLPERWTPLSTKEMQQKTFDGRAASAGLWARFHVEHCCKRNESTIRRYPLWIVAARRDQDAALREMPILSWDERFGVLRLAPLARWGQCCIDNKIRREAIPCDLFLDREEFSLQATSVGERYDDTDDETRERETARFSHAELCYG